MADLNDLTQNVNIWDDSKTKSVSVITDGAVERLAVDASATIVDNESPTRYQLKSDYDTTGTALSTSADSTLFSYTGDGVIDFIAVQGSNANYLIDLEIDGTSRIRISMSDLGSVLGLSNAPNVDIWAETANKGFRYHPQQIGFTTGFKLYARANSAVSPTVYHLILYRERT